MASGPRGGRRVAILQSNYIPWKGYFDLIHDVDLFVFYDDNQYTSRDWRNRNKVKTAQGPSWITVPVGHDRERLICEVEIPESTWQAKHWRTIEQCYGKCPHFTRYREMFEAIYLGSTWTHLSALNQHLIELIAREVLGIATVFADSRGYGAQGSKLDKLLDLLKRIGATHYVSGPAARDYIDEQRFEAAGITLEWKSYADYPEYAQRHPPFEHGVSILDLIFNLGPESPAYIWGWRDGKERQ